MSRWVEELTGRLNGMWLETSKALMRILEVHGNSTLYVSFQDMTWAHMTIVLLPRSL